MNSASCLTNLLFYLTSFLITNELAAQKTVTWEMLADVSFKEEYVEAVDAYYLFPIFGDIPMKLEGKFVQISGYIFPLDVEGDFFVLSQNPFSSCFFCGMAGPETIIEIQFSEKPRNTYEMDDRVTLSGVLQLNSNDIDHCNYILREAGEIK